MTRTDTWAVLLVAVGVGGLAGAMVAQAARALDGPVPARPAPVYVSGVPAPVLLPVRGTGRQWDALR